MSEDVKRRELDTFLQEKLAASLKKLPSVKVSDSERLKQIKTNKKDVLHSERKERAKLSKSTTQEKNIAEVVQLKTSEEDYRFPKYIAHFDNNDEDKPK